LTLARHDPPDKKNRKRPPDQWVVMEFIGYLALILACEIVVGTIIGMALRSVFGWPF